ncbi:MAG: glycosyltransferase [Planctomycetia bacterium]|nr:glycosyltransferase [Planctomycetia bacterium]
MKTLIVLQQEPGISETFLRKQIETLPGEVSVLYCSDPPRLNGKLLKSSKVLYLVRRHLLLQNKQKARGNKYLQAILKSQADIVLVQYGVTAANYIDALEQCGLPFVVHFHGYDASMYEVFQKYALEYKRIFQSASSLIAVSNAMQTRLIAEGAPKQKLKLNYYGIDETAFPAVTPNTKVARFFGVGRFVEKKAPHLTILAFAKVLEQMPQAQLCLLGEGPLLGPCQHMVKALGIEKQVELPGAASHQVVRNEMKNAFCFVQHSVVAANGDSEGTPVAILEALMSGLPVIATRHAGIPDVITDRETGFLVDENDIQAMSARMLEIARNPEKAVAVGLAARQYALKNLTATSSIRNLYSILNEAKDNFHH